MNKLKWISLVLVTTFLMGSSFTVGKLGLAYSSPLLLAAYRFILAGSILAIIVRVLRRAHPAAKEGWVKMLLIGVFQTAGVMGCIFLSLRSITASESSILTFTNPLLVVVLGSFLFKARYKLYQWGGVLLGLTGVVITQGTHLKFEVGTLFGILSALLWAASTLLVKKWGTNFDTWVLSAYQMLFGGLLLLAASFLLEHPFFHPNTHSLSILLWLSVMSSIVQFAGWYYLLQNTDPGKTSAYLFLAPFFGVLTGCILLNDPLFPSFIVGGFFILTGIYLVNRNFQPSKAKRKLFITH
ncbi:DMT family transporter [Fictibacillus terranigra]|uniref:DMT family transporter n=1 Tax=Fictibacillus terranigra TaxID=3058424 RepID=A0ABT8E8V2_9BACL|nr:DMT family transporter [Fictibacillus sp. CENA-BCM004]MDN4074348.1 DMT family transporter [Fictibacillus sp. CENA-BCM004]